MHMNVLNSPKWAALCDSYRSQECGYATPMQLFAQGFKVYFLAFTNCLLGNVTCICNTKALASLKIVQKN